MPPRRRPTANPTEPLFADAGMADAPLAARMRPRTLDEFVGQPHLVGDDGALTRVVSPGHRPSLILWGPPGSGKTTLARPQVDFDAQDNVIQEDKDIECAQSGERCKGRAKKRFIEEE